MTEQQAPPANRWVILAVVLGGVFMILLDATIVNVAIGSIQTDLHAGYGAIEWVLSGYALAYGLLLIPAGRLGDRYGHKPVLLIGLAGFTVASALCGTAGGPGQLVGWRIVQGAMAGLMGSPIVAIIQTTFPPRERGKAFGMYGAIAGVSTALGPLLGGLLIAWNVFGWDWRPIFLVNVPVGAVVLIGVQRLVPRVRGRGGRLDLGGIALVSVGLLLILFPLIEGQDKGWPAWAFVCLVAAAPVLAVFVGWELARVRRGQGALVDVRLFRNRSFAAGTGIGLAYFAGFIGLLFMISLYLQIGLGRPALRTGLTLMPFALGTFAAAAVSDLVAARIGKRVLQVGAGLAAVGILLLLWTVHRQAPEPSGWALLPGLLLGGLGSGLVIAPNVDLVLAGVPQHDAGSASGVLNAAQRVGQGLGIAVIGVALFGAVGAGAAAAVAQDRSAVRARLVATGMPASTVDSTMAGYERCFVARARSTDPTAVPPGCPADSAAGDPVGDALGAAARTALARDFSHGVLVAGWYALGAVLVTFVLVFLLPAGRPAAAGEGEAARDPALVET
jgi:EmrB/QacA subfamily drug resistance transporter